MEAVEAVEEAVKAVKEGAAMVAVEAVEVVKEVVAGAVAGTLLCGCGPAALPRDQFLVD